MIIKLVRGVDAQGLTEYALIMSLIALAVIAALLGITGNIVRGFYEAVNQVLSA